MSKISIIDKAKANLAAEVYSLGAAFAEYRKAQLMAYSEVREAIASIDHKMPYDDLPDEDKDLVGNMAREDINTFVQTMKSGEILVGDSDIVQEIKRMYPRK